MAKKKEIEFSVTAPPSDALLERLADFLVKAAAKKEGIEVSGTVIKRPPGDTGFPVRCSLWQTGSKAS